MLPHSAGGESEAPPGATWVCSRQNTVSLALLGLRFLRRRGRGLQRCPSPCWWARPGASGEATEAPGKISREGSGTPHPRQPLARGCPMWRWGSGQGCLLLGECLRHGCGGEGAGASGRAGSWSPQPPPQGAAGSPGTQRSLEPFSLSQETLLFVRTRLQGLGACAPMAGRGLGGARKENPRTVSCHRARLPGNRSPARPAPGRWGRPSRGGCPEPATCSGPGR